MPSISDTLALSAVQGQTVDLDWTVRNLGTAPAGMYVDRVWLSADGQLDPAGDRLWATIPSQLPDLAAGGGRLVPASLVVPQDLTLAPGSYRILVETDAAPGLVVEADETNNVASIGTLEIALPPLPDLVVADVIAPPVAMPGSTVSVSWTVKNIGGLDADGAWTTEIHLIDQALGSDRLLAVVSSSGSVTAGDPDGLPQSTGVTIPAIGVSGDLKFMVRLLAGGPGQIFEGNASNNLAVALQGTNVPVQLDLTLPGGSIAENAAAPMRATLSRSGATTYPLVVTLGQQRRNGTDRAGDGDHTPRANRR